MRIVVFTSQIANRTGGEINVRDWALALKSRGHKVVVYTPVPGRLAEEIRASGVPLVDDPGAIGDEPDVMYGSGIHEVAALAARFPGVPIVQISQQWESWASFPSPLPQVMLHVSVDEINAGSLANEFGVPRERIRIVRNAVDLAQVKPRKRLLPARPKRALAFVKQPSPYVRALEAACTSRSIALECVGPGTGNVIHDPLAAIAECDLVVGSARTAIEGAAAGAAVLVADHRGLGGLLTTRNHEWFCANNFGREVLTRPLDASAIGAEIDGYDAADAAAVTRVVRERASLERQLELLESIFAEAISAFRYAPTSRDARQRALSTYLSRHLPRHGELSPRHGPQAACDPDPRIVRLDNQIAVLTERLSVIEMDRTSDSPVPQPSELQPPGRAPSGVRRNLLEHSEDLDAANGVSSIASPQRVAQPSPGTSTYLVKAIGGHSEHYVRHTLVAAPGQLTLSLDVREVSSPRLRIQLLDAQVNGVIGDFDFRREEISILRVGQATHLNGGLRAIGGGWYKVWITGRFAHAAQLAFVIQLADRQGGFGFTPRGEASLVRSVQVERGHAPTPYQATSSGRGVVARSRWRVLASRLPGMGQGAPGLLRRAFRST